MRLWSFIFSFILAIPFYHLWNWLAPIYIPNLHEPYLNVPFLHVAGVFCLINIVMIMFSPRIHRHHHHGFRFEKMYRPWARRWGRDVARETYVHTSQG